MHSPLRALALLMVMAVSALAVNPYDTNIQQRNAANNGNFTTMVPAIPLGVTGWDSGLLACGYTPAQIVQNAGFTTLSAYGIANGVSTGGSYANPSWITSIAWGKITGTPTTLSGYGIIDPIVLTSGSYADPGWITSLAWSKVATTPTTLGGYGITDAYSKTASDARYAQIATSLAGYGITDGVSTASTYSNPSWLTSIAWSKVASTPSTISGYGISDGVSTGGSYSNPTWITGLAFSKISGTPTALAGYGITDAYTKTASDARYAQLATTLAGYGITDGVSTGGSYTNPSWLVSIPSTKVTGLGSAALQPTTAFEQPLTFNAPLTRSGNTVSYSGPLVQTTQATTDASGNYTWTFPVAYSTAPKILVSCQNASTTVSYNVQTTSVSTTQTTVHSFSLSVLLLVLTLSTGAPCTVTIQATGN